MHSLKIGINDKERCDNCDSVSGYKLTDELLWKLSYDFFVKGTLHKADYGAAPIIQCNDKRNTEITVPLKLTRDIKLIENIIKIGFFYYGPRLWMLGEIEPLKNLINKKTRNNMIQKIIQEYPIKTLCQKDKFYRLRINPVNEANHDEYDSPPEEFLENGRFDSKKLPILYASQDVEVCIHECRVTVEDELYLATLIPNKTLKLLDLTDIIEDNEDEFESLDLAIHMLFYAGKHSYNISRSIAKELQKQSFDGIIYPSYFSIMRTGAMPFDTVYGISIRKIETLKNHAKSQVIPNIALFGRPLKEKKVIVSNINKLILNKIDYDFGFGPIEY